MDLLELHPSGTVGIVSRRVLRSRDVVDLVLAHGGAELPPFRSLPAELRSWGWRAELRLPWPRPSLTPAPLVGLEVSEWSSTATELRLAPVAAHSLRWSARRWNRYFAMAHKTADDLVDLLEAAQTPLPVRPPSATASYW